MLATHRLAACSLIVFAAPVFARDIGSFDRTLNVNGPVDLEVATHSGRITVRPGNTATVQIHAVISTSDDLNSPDVREIENNPPIQQTGNSIRLDSTDSLLYCGIVLLLAAAALEAMRGPARRGAKDPLEALRWRITGSRLLRGQLMVNDEVVEDSQRLLESV